MPWLRVAAPLLGLVLAILAHMINNTLPLMATLVRVAAGEPLPDGPESPAGMDFFTAFAEATWDSTSSSIGLSCC